MSGYRTQSLDTPEAVERIVFAGYRRMSPAEKMARMVELSRAAEGFSRAGLRARHPGLDDEQIDVKLAEVRLGPDLVARVLERRSQR